MKGLVYREYLSVRKNIIVIVLIASLLMVLDALFLLSYRFGNLKNSTSQSVQEMRPAWEGLYYAVSAILMSGVTFFFGNSIFSDYKSGWMTYAYTLPGGMKRSVLAKYVSGLLYEVIAFGVSVILSIVVNVCNGKPITGKMFGILFAFFVSFLLIGCLASCLAYLLKTPNKTMAVISVPMILAMIWFYTKMMGAEGEEGEAQLLLEFVGYGKKLYELRFLLLIAALCLCVACYFISVCLKDRRER